MKENRISDLNAEVGILSSLLIDDSILPQALEEVREEYFFYNRYRTIFKAIKNLYARRKPIDLITLADELKMENVFEKVGGVETLNIIGNLLNTSANYSFYARILKEKYHLRVIMNTCNGALAEIDSAKLSAEEILDGIVSSILTLDFTDKEKKLLSLQELLKRYSNLTEQAEQDFVYTGFSNLDNLVSPLSAGQLIILAARPSVGKTALALQIMTNVAIRQKKTVVFYSVEQSKKEILCRLLAQKGLYSMSEIFGLRLTKSEIASYLQEMEKAKIYINDYGKIKVSDIRQEIDALRRKGIQPDFLIVDYLQLLTADRVYKSKYEEVSALSREMKLLAKDVGAPVLVLSQLNRELENREDKRPRLSDLRDSGSLEQDADKVMFLYRDELYNKDTDYPGVVEVITRKNRNGKRGTIMLYFDEPYITFSPVDNRE